MRLLIFTTMTAAALALSACANPNSPDKPLAGTTTGSKTYGDLPFWDGDVCIEIQRNGKRSIVPAIKCPPKE